MGVDARACDLGANGRAERGGKERKGRGGGVDGRVTAVSCTTRKCVCVRE